MKQHGARYDQGLPRLETIDACQNVDGVRAKDDQRHHVQLVNHPQLQVGRQREEGAQDLGHHYACAAGIGREEGQGCHAGEEKLDPPRNVQHIISKAEKQHEANGGKSCIVIH